ncbi:MAG: PIN domain-containing protein [Candidatus Bathyarchaeia archaeon]
MSGLRGSYAVDAGALLELVYGTESGAALKEALLSEKVYAMTHSLALTELWYILCRRLGWEEAEERVKALQHSGYVEVVDIEALMREAAHYKCERSLSLPDCFTLSLGKERSIPALFSRRERELEEEMNKEDFSIDIHFLVEMNKNRKTED